MRPAVDLQILRSRKRFRAIGTRKRLFPGVDAHVIHQLVLGLETRVHSTAPIPVAEII